jgi:hypothetical protein
LEEWGLGSVNVNSILLRFKEVTEFIYRLTALGVGLLEVGRCQASDDFLDFDLLGHCITNFVTEAEDGKDIGVD